MRNRSRHTTCSDSTEDTKSRIYSIIKHIKSTRPTQITSISRNLSGFSLNLSNKCLNLIRLFKINFILRFGDKLLGTHQTYILTNLLHLYISQFNLSFHKFALQLISEILLLQIFNNLLLFGNSSVNTALAACLPEGKSLMRLYSSCDLHDSETLFAHMARILSAMRHADAQEAASAAQAYFSSLQKLAEKK